MGGTGDGETEYAKLFYLVCTLEVWTTSICDYVLQ